MKRCLLVGSVAHVVLVMQTGRLHDMSLHCFWYRSPFLYCRRYDVTDFAALKSQFQLASEKGMSQAMFDVDLKVGAGGGSLRGGWFGLVLVG